MYAGYNNYFIWSLGISFLAIIAFIVYLDIQAEDPKKNAKTLSLTASLTIGAIFTTLLTCIFHGIFLEILSLKEIALTENVLNQNSDIAESQETQGKSILPDWLQDLIANFLLLGDAIFWMFLFYNGLRLEGDPEAISQNKKGLLTILGRRIKLEVGEGVYWWFPVIGSVDDYDFIRSVGSLCYEGDKVISLPDGSTLKRVDIDLAFMPQDGRLFQLSELGESPFNYLKVIAEDRVRTGSIITVKSIPEEVKKKEYNNIDAVILNGSLIKWKSVIKNGVIKKGCVFAPNPDDPLEDIDYSIFTLEKANVQALVKNGYALEQVPETGIEEAAYDVGINLIEVNIASSRLPDAINDAINDALREPIERHKETQDTETAISLVQKIIAEKKAQNGGELPEGFDFDALLDRVLISQGKEGITINRIVGDTNNAASIGLLSGIASNSSRSNNGEDSND